MALGGDVVFFATVILQLLFYKKNYFAMVSNAGLIC
jgi:hypothetical protein